MLRQPSRRRLFDGLVRAFERAGVREHVERDEVVDGDAPKNPVSVPLDIPLGNCGHALREAAEQILSSASPKTTLEARSPRPEAFVIPSTRSWPRCLSA